MIRDDDSQSTRRGHKEIEIILIVKNWSAGEIIRKNIPPSYSQPSAATEIILALNALGYGAKGIRIVIRIKNRVGK